MRRRSKKDLFIRKRSKSREAEIEEKKAKVSKGEKKEQMAVGWTSKLI